MANVFSWELASLYNIFSFLFRFSKYLFLNVAECKMNETKRMIRLADIIPN